MSIASVGGEQGRRKILTWIDEDRERIIAFLRDFIRIATPNPPGNTRQAGDFVGGFLERNGLPYRVIAPEPSMPNIVAAFDGGAGAGKHLVLNGHMDVFPVGGSQGWTTDCWGGELRDGRIWGRGACDMKCGTTASIFTYLYLSRLRAEFSGRLTLTVVSDEETFGEWGARFLVANHPEVLGDCCLNGEPSSRHTLRFGEKGLVWLRFDVATGGGHAAYPHRGESATKIAARLILALERLEGLRPEIPAEIEEALAKGRAEIEAGLGRGAADIVSRVTVNIGTISGGLKVNMIPDACGFEADIRYPVGMEKQQTMAEIHRILAEFPHVQMQELNHTAPNSCDPNGAMAGILRRNAERVSGVTPSPIISLGGTDARLWRYAGVPAYVYGPSPESMGRPDESVSLDDVFHVLTVHALSAWDYLRSATAD